MAATSPLLIPVGDAPFRLFPDYKIRNGHVQVVDLFEALAAVSSVVGLALHGDDELVLTQLERDGLAYLSLSLTDAFEHLGELIPAAIERAAAGAREPEAEPVTPRSRRTAPDPSGVPDLTEPADPPRTAHG